MGLSLHPANLPLAPALPASHDEPHQCTSVPATPPWVPFSREAVVSLLPGSHGFEPGNLRFSELRRQNGTWCVAWASTHCHTLGKGTVAWSLILVPPLLNTQSVSSIHAQGRILSLFFFPTMCPICDLPVQRKE